MKGLNFDESTNLAEDTLPENAALPAAFPGPEDVRQLVELEAKISAGCLNQRAALEFIARQALLLTRASGVAIGLLAGDRVVCQASAGAAPEVGSRMQIDRGLSGECFRTGKIVHCDDTRHDPRVDPAACRDLGLRSALILPIGRDGAVVGVFDVLSAEPYAFLDRDRLVLRRIADLVAALAGEAALPQTSAVPDSSRARARSTLLFKYLPVVLVLAAVLASLSQTRQILHLRSQALPPGKDVSGLVPSDATQQADQPPAVQTALTAAQEENPSARVAPPKPAPVPPTSPAATTPVPDNASGALPPNVLPLVADVLPPASQAPQPQRPAFLDGERWPEPLLVPGPIPNPLAVGPQRETVVAAVTPASAERPRLTTDDLRSLRDVKGGKLVHRVEPVYPEAAKAAHPKGPVVLRATISKDGSVQNVSVASGDQLLAEAAVRAVTQWRYTPYIVRGQPVDVDTKITLTFANSGFSRLLKTAAKPITVLFSNGKPDQHSKAKSAPPQEP